MSLRDALGVMRGQSETLRNELQLQAAQAAKERAAADAQLAEANAALGAERSRINELEVPILLSTSLQQSSP